MITFFVHFVPKKTWNITSFSFSLFCICLFNTGNMMFPFKLNKSVYSVLVKSNKIPYLSEWDPKPIIISFPVLMIKFTRSNWIKNSQNNFKTCTKSTSNSQRTYSSNLLKSKKERKLPCQETRKREMVIFLLMIRDPKIKFSTWQNNKSRKSWKTEPFITVWINLMKLNRIVYSVNQRTEFPIP